MACLLHDIAIAGLIPTHHGHWGAQLIAPYVDEEVAWAVENHEALRYFADESVGYSYPEAYIAVLRRRLRPPGIHPPGARGSAQAPLVHDLPADHDQRHLFVRPRGGRCSSEEFEDIIGRNFRQPEEGLGFDGSPVAHMWRTMIWPNNFL